MSRLTDQIALIAKRFTVLLQDAKYPILLFPVIVVQLSSIAFLCGGSCTLWQWWIALAVAMSIPFVRNGFKSGMSCCGLLLLAILGMCIVAFANFDYNYCDSLVYHIPATRMLIDGWNPVLFATPEKICESMHINPFDMQVWNVLSAQKSVWIFNAVAAKFHGDMFSITHSAEFFVSLSFALFIAVELKWHWVAKLSLLGLVWLNCFYPFVVDTVVGVSGLGLLIAMQLSINDRQFRWLPLFTFSFWMVSAKAFGTLACFAMWIVFSIWYLYKTRLTLIASLRKTALAGILIGVNFVIVCASPYFSAWRDYGHPLYPAATIDESRFPQKLITIDLLTGNADRQKMGWAGSFVNAYISPTLARAYYKWRLNKEDFWPMTTNWYAGASAEGEPTSACPTTFRFRAFLWLGLALLFCLPKWRMTACAAVLALLLAPGHCYYGYTRYFPWIIGCEILSAACLVELAINMKKPIPPTPLLRYVGYFSMGFILLISALSLPKLILKSATTIDYKIATKLIAPISDAYVVAYAISIDKTKSIPPELQIDANGREAAGLSRIGINAIKLLARHVHFLQLTEIHGISPLDQDLYTLATKQYKSSPLGFHTPTELSLPLIANEYNADTSRWRRIVGYPVYVVRMFTEGLYRLVFNNVCNS